MNILPLLAIQVLNFSYQKPLESNILKERNIDNDHTVNSLRDNLNHFGSLNTLSGKLFGSIVGLLGLDIAVDGTLNTVPAILSSMQLPLTAFGLPLVPIVTGILLVGSFTTVAISQINKYEFKEAEFADKLIDCITESIYSNCEKIFDELMEKLCRMVGMQLAVIFKTDLVLTKRFNIEKSLVDIKSMKNEIMGLINESTI